MLKRIPVFSIAGLLLLTLLASSGCQALKDAVNDSPPAARRRDAEVRPEQRRNTQKRTRDPLDDLFFGERERKQAFAGADLSPVERRAVEEQLRGGEATQAEINRIHRRNEEKRKKDSEWVFGPNPFR